MRFFKSLKAQATGYLDQFKQRDPASFAAAQQAVGGLLILDGFIGIDSPLSNNKRPGIFGTLIGVILGIIFMFVPTIFTSVSGMNDLTAETSATVTSVSLPSVSQDSNGSSSSTCTFTSKFTVDGKQYQSQSSMSSSSYCQLQPDQQVRINYNPKNPSQWAYDIKTVGLFLSIFFWVGLLIVLSSIVTFGIRLISIIFGWRLLRSGRKLAASLPQGVNLGTMIDEIKQDFTHGVFGLTSPSLGENDGSLNATDSGAVQHQTTQATESTQTQLQPSAPVQVPVPLPPQPAQPFNLPQSSTPEQPDKPQNP